MAKFEQSLEQNGCPTCGALVKKENLRAHYEKVHSKRTLSVSGHKPPVAQLRGARHRSRRRLIFYGLLVTGIVLISSVAALVVSENTIRIHAESQLSVLIQGAPSTVPSGIGVNQSLWRDHTLDRYGVTGRSPLTTRDTSGTIHIDSNTVRNFTLQEFLGVWGETVDNSRVVGYQVPSGDSSCIVVNGQTLPSTADVVLADKLKVTVEIIPGVCSSIS